MLPGVDGFSWSAGHLIFLGVFFAVALTIGATMTFAMVRAVLDIKLQKAEPFRWKADFEDLPRSARPCRHEFTGEVAHRTCTGGFECGRCAVHARFVQARDAGTVSPAARQPDPAGVFGFEMPPDRLYHRGHTCVKVEPDGTLLVGLDDFALRLLGGSCQLELPEAGAHVCANGTACLARRNGTAVRILSPVEGEVVEMDPSNTGWLFKVKPASTADTRHLLQGVEVRAWILREIERLELALASEGVGLSLADGGEVVHDVPAACPNADWNEIWSEIFLTP